MSKRKPQHSDDWEKFLQVVRVEEPIAPAAVASRFPTLRFSQVCDALDEMVRAGLLRYDWLERDGKAHVMLVCRD